MMLPAPPPFPSPDSLAAKLRLSRVTKQELPLMKRTSLLLCGLLAVLLTACTYIPRVGMTERKWIRNTISYDLVYIQGDVKAYRSDGAYYYFKGGKLVTVNQTLLAADRVGN